MIKKPVQPQDKYVLRLPDGLRDRIKAHADREGTSMNYEIVRVLEREWPEQWPLGKRLQELGDALSLLSAGKTDPRVQQFITDFEETVHGIITGRVTDVDPETRDAVGELWSNYRERQAEIEADLYEPEYSDEELRAMEVVGRPEKYAVPPPEKANPLHDAVYLSEVLPKYDFAEFTKRLSENDVEGAKAILDSIPKDKLEKQIQYANMSLWDRIQMEENRRNLNKDTDPDFPF
ncbi:Arc family DNA-binding protein [Brucella pseudogrignonensis]|uniref:Arc family DNA-binding protein n=1 Tax=Brucella pseudogrignonensis TaxID=419475 RepID=UPI0028B3F4C0|nr:Arc family DNA-binding protein [Brucella pseudogrignonensis]MDT6940705.1 Arc family DNA-binding protein [Brucella pseudogrignonensis]